MSEIIVNRLQPISIHKIWKKLLYGIQQAAPITNARSDEAYANVLASLLAETAQCFVAYKPGNPPEVQAFFISVVKHDDLTKDKYLFIYSFYGFRPLTPEIWDKLQETVEAFAKEQGCIAITGFTNNEYLLAQYRKRGAKTDQIFVYKEVR